MSKKPDAYGVWDTVEQRWWQRNRKAAWMTPSGAGNAWNAENARRRYVTREKDVPLYSQQTRFVTKPLRFVAMEDDA
jgi:hypothetical protein